MFAFVVRRLIWGVFIVLGVIVLAFFAVEAAPGDPFAHLESPKMTKEDLALIKEKWGYGPDKTTMDRFGIYIKRLVLEQDLGDSIAQGRPVSQILSTAIPNTLKLTVAALILDLLLGISLGVIQAFKQHSWLDRIGTFGSLFLYSMPGFWLALMLALIFAVTLGWLPRHGINSPGESGFGDYLKHLILPAFTLGVAAAAYTARFQRSALLEVIRQDYIRTARAKGLSETKVIWKHAMKNALLPTITLFGLYLPFLMSGTIIIESIFAWPGMGLASIQAINARDPQVVTAITIVATTMVVLGSLIADILYAVVDPRVRLS
ncbi:MAG: ABC transporter permease [Planctomycetota bacterium]|nr:ABC transporter permease [Planctomycetota bacterium]